MVKLTTVEDEVTFTHALKGYHISQQKHRNVNKVKKRYLQCVNIENITQNYRICIL